MVNSIKQLSTCLNISNQKYQLHQKNRVCLSKDGFSTHDLSLIKAAKINSNLEQVLPKISDIFDQCAVIEGLEEETVLKIKEELLKLEQRYFSKYNCFTKLIFYSNYSKKQAAFNQVNMSIALFENRFKNQFAAAKALQKAHEDEALKTQWNTLEQSCQSLKDLQVVGIPTIVTQSNFYEVQKQLMNALTSSVTSRLSTLDQFLKQLETLSGELNNYNPHAQINNDNMHQYVQQTGANALKLLKIDGLKKLAHLSINFQIRTQKKLLDIEEDPNLDCLNMTVKHHIEHLNKWNQFLTSISQEIDGIETAIANLKSQ